jgi:hypothetical protein
MRYYQMEYVGNVGWINLTDTVKNTCVVVVGEGDSEVTCEWEDNHEYHCIVKKDDGTEIQASMHVCDRHKIIFEEFMNEQGAYQW